MYGPVKAEFSLCKGRCALVLSSRTFFLFQTDVGGSNLTMTSAVAACHKHFDGRLLYEA